MSASEPAPRNEDVRLSDDVVPSRPVLVTVAAVVVVTFVLIGCAALWLGWAERRDRPSGRFPERDLGAPTNLRGLEERLFDREAGGLRELDDARRGLARWEWIDRERRVARPPIDRAIEDVVREGAR